MTKKFGIKSKSKGWLVISNPFVFNEFPTFIVDFLSVSGAKGLLEIAPLLDINFPNDCEILEWFGD